MSMEPRGSFDSRNLSPVSASRACAAAGGTDRGAHFRGAAIQLDEISESDPICQEWRGLKGLYLRRGNAPRDYTGFVFPFCGCISEKGIMPC